MATLGCGVRIRGDAYGLRVIAAVAFLPAAPILVPDVAGAAAAELDGLRRACADALSAVLAERPDRVVLVGVDDTTVVDAPPAAAGAAGAARPPVRALPDDAVGSLRGVGLDLAVPLDPALWRPGTAATLPMPHTVGAWLLARSGWPGPREALVVDPDLAPGAAFAAGVALTAGPGRVALVVLGDGSACRTEKAPGYVADDAAPYDAAVVAALAAVDADALAALDEATATRLMVSGRVPWQVAAGAVAAGGPWAGTVLAAEAPYGVGYVVATWRRVAG